ncbi:MAG: hypothetical protein A3H63_00440 [Candidatus Harrisonbacteria bacterium RIFCSPLOWO2_02_FULL_45_10c]|uniref:Prepilin peptidase n=1 Tax=Candidatus Harrisonbacteria bacterium RIFCSPLOWO2_02_FULL_45_10c TaxID=1798410 RepID=A0A1G1ZVK9_9BACT|nr:MAG: hypothetical protein A3H63_00440 [Candidatus Harrisonbacteria bacterium RIFCSPLOWO2_02_FULL_45_10c]
MYLPALLFVFGLSVGSFLNVISLRYSPERNLLATANHPSRSRCLSCGHELSWLELIPIFSFLIQRGRCRQCQVPLAWQYPLVELASGFIFLLPIYLQNPLIPTALFLIQSAVWISVFLIFLLIWTIDFRLLLIPDGLILALTALGLLLIGVTATSGQFGEWQGSFIGNFAALFGFRSNVWINHGLAAVAGALAIGIIILITRGRGMGMGDLKLAVPLGLLFGWPDIIFVLAFSFLIGAIISLALLAFKKSTMKDMVPFGPFLVMGSLTVFFFGKVILENYFNFFGFK